MWKYSAGFPHIGSPSTRTLPLLGLVRPVMSFMKVDLPAPLGPSSPVMPGGTVTVTSLSPITCPYHLLRRSAVTIGVDALVTRPPRRLESAARARSARAQSVQAP